MQHKGKDSLVLTLVIGFVVFISVNAFSFGFSDRDRNTMNLQTFIVSDFGDKVDKGDGIIWTARFSRFAKPADSSKEMSKPDTNACAVDYFKAKPLGLPKQTDKDQVWSLGIKAQFIKQSYNWIELVPMKAAGGVGEGEAKPVASGDTKFNPLVLQGVVKSLDVWIWGGNYRYWVEFYLRDYKGFLHRLNAGDIAYVGWKNVRTKVPKTIKQAEHHVPFMKPLKLEMIKFWSYPTERVDQFYSYIDYMQVQTDVYEERFNGDDLSKNKW